MVKLSYKFRLKANFQQVWKYFSNFQTIGQYDPCVKSSVLIQKGNNTIGNKYDITTLHNGKQSKMIYEVTKYKEQMEVPLRKFYIEIYGENQKLTSTDEIILQQVSRNQNQFNLIFQYRADICFRGLWMLATPFALGTFNKIAENAQKGAKKKCLQNWGQDSLQQSTKLKLLL